MPIYIDVSSAVHSKAGIGRYAGSLAAALAARMPGQIALFYNRSGDARLPPGLENVPARFVRAGYKPWRMAVWVGHLARLGFNRLVPDVELYHATEHLLPPLKEVPTVLTVHDMIFRMFPEHQKVLNYWYLNVTMPLYCRKADAIITVSLASKQDILRLYRLDPAKVTVVYEAASPEFAPAEPAMVEEGRRRLGLPDRYLLHVGTIEPRKNLTRLVEALQLLRDQGQRIPLFIVGRRGWLYDHLFQRLSELEVRDSVVFPGYVAAADLPLFYAAATAAVVPSVYEGFGLPVLEAMACGTPVVSSTAACLSEIGSDAPQYFEPTSIPAMAEAISKVWADADLRSEMRARGLVRAAQFSWAKAAEETAAIYQRLTEERLRAG